MIHIPQFKLRVNKAMDDFVQRKYFEHYRYIGFERTGLFEFIRNNYNCQTVIYPGCLFHVTVSFVFNHVLYIDKSEESKQFFENEKSVIRLISNNKRYKGKSYYKFISGEVVSYCEKYLKRGGIVLTNSLFSDYEIISQKSNFIKINEIGCKNRKYQILNKAGERRKRTKSKLKRMNNKLKYIDNEIYYIYKKEE